MFLYPQEGRRQLILGLETKQIDAFGDFALRNFYRHLFSGGAWSLRIRRCMYVPKVRAPMQQHKR